MEDFLNSTVFFVHITRILRHFSTNFDGTLVDSGPSYICRKYST